MNSIISSSSSLQNLTLSFRAQELDLELYNNHGLLSFVDEREKTKNAFNALIYKNLLLQLTTDLPTANFILLKGLSLLTLLYENQPYRPFTDLDLLVSNEEDRRMIDQYFLKKGYKKLFDRLSPHKTVYSIFDSDNELVIEVHSRLFKHCPYDPEVFFINELKLYTLAPYDQCLFLIYHLVYQHTFLKLMWLNDIYLLFEKYNLDNNVLLKKSVPLGLKKSLLLFFTARKIFYGKESEIRVPIFFRILISKNFLLRPKNHFIRYHLIKIASKKNFLSAIKYYFLWIKNFLTKKKFTR
jgi:hypothetical protein